MEHFVIIVNGWKKKGRVEKNKIISVMYNYGVIPNIVDSINYIFDSASFKLYPFHWRQKQFDILD